MLQILLQQTSSTIKPPLVSVLVCILGFFTKLGKMSGLMEQERTTLKNKLCKSLNKGCICSIFHKVNTFFTNFKNFVRILLTTM